MMDSMSMPDPMERAEASVDQWFFDNCKGDIATCHCGEEFNLAQGFTISPDPFAIPMCEKCFDNYNNEFPVDKQTPPSP